ncbi:MAG: hypothetical protein AAF525_01990 [Pseudomonadota bacterium]
MLPVVILDLGFTIWSGSMSSSEERLIAQLLRFPGVEQACRVDEAVRVDFEADQDGTVAELVWLRVAERLKLARSDEDTWILNAERLDDARRIVRYASSEVFADHDNHIQPGEGQASETLVFFDHLADLYNRLNSEFQKTAGIPYEVWANALRAFDDASISRSEFGARTILADRAVRVVLRDLEQLEWIETSTSGRTPVFGLSGKGREIKRRADDALALVASTFHDAIGDKLTGQLAVALASVVDPTAYELPWAFTGYGPGDGSPTGGAYVSSQADPHFIPAHGAEWPVVERAEVSTVSGDPLPTLISRTLLRFMIDYEHLGVGGFLQAVAYQSMPDDGVSLQTAKANFGVSGTGRSGPERHLYLVTPIGHGKKRQVYLTPKWKAERDALASGLAALESIWCENIGKSVFTETNQILEQALSVMKTEPVDPHVHPTRWFHELHSVALRDED